MRRGGLAVALYLKVRGMSKGKRVHRMPRVLLREMRGCSKRDTRRCAKTQPLSALQRYRDMSKPCRGSTRTSRARRKLQEFEAIMREYHDSRAAPPLALRRVK